VNRKGGEIRQIEKQKKDDEKGLNTQKKKTKRMRYEHYQRVVKWDRIHAFPERKNGNEVPKVEKLTRVWSLIGLGFHPKWIPAAWTALEGMTGQKPKRVYTKKSVAQRRLKEGDPVACQVTVTGKPAYARREEWRMRVFPEVRPFGGFAVRSKGDAGRATRGEEGPGRLTQGVVDERGQLTFHLEQPGGIPARAPYYEAYFPLVAGSTGSNTGGRYRSVHTTAKSKEAGLALMEGRRFPRTRKTEA
jgi:large subunit ribosomal protein L5